MLNVTKKPLQYAIGAIIYKITTDLTFRQQVIENSEFSIKTLEPSLSKQEQVQLIKTIEKFMTIKTDNEVQELINPDLAPQGFW